MRFRIPFTGRRERFARATTRHTCAVEGSLMMMDRIVSFPGRIIDLSGGGALFRPRLAYPLDRRDVPVCLTVGAEELFGRITATSPRGFHIHFDEAITDAEVLAIVGTETKSEDTGFGKAA